MLLAHMYQIMFILTNAVCAFIFAVAYPETKGKSLEEIDEIFGDVKIVHEDDIAGKKDGFDNVEVRKVKTEE
jgi:hypothetical protein